MAPAMLDDPSRPPIHRLSGPLPHPTSTSPLPPTIVPRHVTLRDRITTATLLPIASPSLLPPTLLSYLCDQLNREIEAGDTYPMLDALPVPQFASYWFANFGAVMVLGEYPSVGGFSASPARDWSRECLGSFYIRPNYPGRSSHVCNGGFLVTTAARNKGVGRLMGEAYLEWAPLLGYSYSVFNLVYETNVASCRIWDALGFKRIGRVPRCGNLKSYPGELVDALVYGRDLGPDGEDFVSEERFDKIRFYLKFGKYPSGADRAEKSRLRSAATHYKLLPPVGDEGKEGDAQGEERLMLKDKEVVSDPQRQYEIARGVHTALQHGGINKTTARIAEGYHWVRIKETVSLVIRNCGECREGAGKERNGEVGGLGGTTTTTAVVAQQQDPTDDDLAVQSQLAQTQTQPPPEPSSFAPDPMHPHPDPAHPLHVLPAASGADDDDVDDPTYADIPLDPQIMEDVRHHLSHFASASAASSPAHHHHHLSLSPAAAAADHAQHTDYQALLSTSVPPSPRHAHSDDAALLALTDGSADGTHETMEGVSVSAQGEMEGMARRARAAARAAQQAMDVGGLEDGDVDAYDGRGALN